MTLLNTGDQFPELTLNLPDGETRPIAYALGDGYGVALFYRGSWCPYCIAQLRAFERAKDSLAEVGAKVVALSIDDEATTAELVAKHRLTFPVGHSADAAAVSAATGAFVEQRRGILQSTGFVLNPAGKVMVSVYSSGAIGRLVPEDVVGMLKYARAAADKAAAEKAAAAAAQG